MILVLTKRFKNQVRKSAENDKYLREKITNTLKLLEKDPFDSKLHTHKLKGELSNCRACSVGYDYRIIFEIKATEEQGTKIVLHSFGTHDDVY